MVRFKEIGIGEKFTYNDMTWIKVTPVKKRCCTVLYNAHVDGNLDIKKVFDSQEQVEKA